MKIENKTFTDNLNSPQKRQPAAPEPGPLRGRDEAAHVVNLSSKAEQENTDRDEELRREKVAAIRDQLASGSYNISGRDVASKILNALKG